MDIFFIILGQFLMYLPLTMGAYISFNLLAVPDFSIESGYLFGAICAIKILPFISTLPLIFQLIIICMVACIFGGVSGLVSGSLTQYLRLNHALSSIITLGLFQGISYFLLGTGHKSLSNHNPLELIAGFSKNPELITLLFIGVLFILIFARIMFTQLGYCLAAYGHNNKFFNNYNISTSFVFIIGLIISNGCAGLSGYLVAQSNGYIDLSMGFGLPLMCLSTVMLGSLIINKAKPISLMLPITGLISYLLLQQLLLKAGFTSLYFSSAQAFIILLGTFLRSNLKLIKR